ncbi:MAG: zf-HC2 domain-containing protein [Planctomycetota bacterium]|jgi:hypothetical protein
MNCETLDTVLDAYLDGECTPDTAGEVEVHLEECPNCRKRVEEEKELRALWASVDVPDPGGPFWEAFAKRTEERALRTVPSSRFASPPRLAKILLRWTAAAGLAAGWILAIWALMDPSALEPEIHHTPRPLHTPQPPPPGPGRESVLAWLEEFPAAEAERRKAILEEIRGLGRQGSRWVAEAMEGGDKGRVGGAILVCASLKLTRGEDALLRLLEDPHWAPEALKALSAVSPRKARPLVVIALGNDALHEAALGSVAILGDVSLIPRVLPSLQMEKRRDAAVACLASLGAEGVRTLTRLLEGRDESLTRLSLHALERLRPPGAYGTFIRCLRKTSLRVDAIRILGNLGNPEAIPHMAEILGNRTLEVPIHEAVERIGERGVAVLERLLRSQDIGRRRDAVTLLGCTRHASAVKPLV